MNPRTNGDQSRIIRNSAGVITAWCDVTGQGHLPPVRLAAITPTTAQDLRCDDTVIMPAVVPADDDHVRAFHGLLLGSVLGFVALSLCAAGVVLAIRDAKADRAAEIPSPIPSTVPDETPELMLYREFSIDTLPPLRQEAAHGR